MAGTLGAAPGRIGRVRLNLGSSGPLRGPSGPCERKNDSRRQQSAAAIKTRPRLARAERPALRPVPAGSGYARGPEEAARPRPARAVTRVTRAGEKKSHSVQARGRHRRGVVGRSSRAVLDRGTRVAPSRPPPAPSYTGQRGRGSGVARRALREVPSGAEGDPRPSTRYGLVGVARPRSVTGVTGVSRSRRERR